MRNGFLINAIIEAIAAIVLFFAPSGFFIDTDLFGLHMIKLYAILAFSLSVLSYLLFKHFKSNAFFRHCFLVLMFFHLAVSFNCFGMFSSGLDLAFYASLTHGFIFLILSIIYLKNLS